MPATKPLTTNYARWSLWRSWHNHAQLRIQAESFFYKSFDLSHCRSVETSAEDFAHRFAPYARDIIHVLRQRDLFRHPRRVPYRQANLDHEQPQEPIGILGADSRLDFLVRHIASL